MQLPHPAHSSVKTPACGTAPKNSVFIPGYTGILPILSDRKLTPTPHAVESTRSYVLTSSIRGSKNSGSQCLSIPACLTSIGTPSSAAFILIIEASISASLFPPAWQIATQVLQPKTSTLLNPLTISHISSKGFCSPTIIAAHSFLT